MHAGFNAQLTIARASLAIAGAAPARCSYMDELSHQTSADTPGVLRTGMQRVSEWCSVCALGPWILMCLVRSPKVLRAVSRRCGTHLHCPFSLGYNGRLTSAWSVCLLAGVCTLCDPLDSLLDDDAFDWLDSPGPPLLDAAAADDPPSLRPGSPIEDDALPVRSAALPTDVVCFLPLWREACPAGLRHALGRACSALECQALAVCHAAVAWRHLCRLPACVVYLCTHTACRDEQL